MRSLTAVGERCRVEENPNCRFPVVRRTIEKAGPDNLDYRWGRSHPNHSNLTTAMETRLKTVRIDLALPLADEARLRTILIDMGYEWGIAIFQESDRSWVELHLPEDFHSTSVLRAVNHALRDMGSDAIPGDPILIG